MKSSFRLAVFLALCASLSSVPVALGAFCTLYSENFDDGTATDFTSGQFQVRWCDAADIPQSFNTPLCMSGQALRTNNSTTDPTIWVSKGTQSCTQVRISYTYYQFASASVTVNYQRSDDAAQVCEKTGTFTTGPSHLTTGSCISTSYTVAFNSNKGVYVRFEHPSNSNAMYIDNLTIEVDGCSCSPSCDTTFSANFGTSFQSGSVCSLFPSLFQSCLGSGPYISSGAPCGGAGDMAMSFASGFPYSAAITQCLDFSSFTNPVLQFAYSTTISLGPKVYYSIDSGSNYTELSFTRTTDGTCQTQCLSLSSITLKTNVLFKFESGFSSGTITLDDIQLADAVCPSATPTPSKTPTATNTPPPTPTDTPVPTETPTTTGTAPPTVTLPPTTTPSPTATPTGAATNTPVGSPSPLASAKKEITAGSAIGFFAGSAYEFNVTFTQFTGPPDCQLTVVFYDQAPPGVSFQALNGYWVFELCSGTTAYKADVTFTYDPVALPPGLSESDLDGAFRKASAWGFAGGTVLTSSHQVSLQGVTDLTGIWTVGALETIPSLGEGAILLLMVLLPVEVVLLHKRRVMSR